MFVLLTAIGTIWITHKEKTLFGNKIFFFVIGGRTLPQAQNNFLEA